MAYSAKIGLPRVGPRELVQREYWPGDRLPTVFATRAAAMGIPKPAPSNFATRAGAVWAPTVVNASMPPTRYWSRFGSMSVSPIANSMRAIKRVLGGNTKQYGYGPTGDYEAVGVTYPTCKAGEVLKQDANGNWICGSIMSTGVNLLAMAQQSYDQLQAQIAARRAAFTTYQKAIDTRTAAVGAANTAVTDAYAAYNKVISDPTSTAAQRDAAYAQVQAANQAVQTAYSTTTPVVQTALTTYSSQLKTPLTTYGTPAPATSPTTPTQATSSSFVSQPVSTSTPSVMIAVSPGAPSTPSRVRQGTTVGGKRGAGDGAGAATDDSTYADEGTGGGGVLDSVLAAFNNLSPAAKVATVGGLGFGIYYMFFRK